MKVKEILIILVILTVAGLSLKNVISENLVSDDNTSAVEDVVDSLLERRASSIDESKVDFGNNDEINILFLGLDAREDNDLQDAHCDAIHMFTFNVKNWDISITSVPRGTYTYIPNGPYGNNEYYLANACAFAGLDYGVRQIEKIVGVKADYVATVGFSQTLGILRLFDLPTTESLEWLRHRQSYQIGDPQRSHNQAVFMKDMIINHLDKFRSIFGLPMQYMLFSLIDTDIDFATAHTILNGYLDAGIDKQPDNIQLYMKPWYKTVDYHFDPENADEQIQALYSVIAPHLSKEDFSDLTETDIQNRVIDFINKKLDSEESVVDLINKRFWLQINDNDIREDLHYKIIEKYSIELVGKSTGDAIDLISDYILEMDTLGLSEWSYKGKELLGNILQ